MINKNLIKVKKLLIIKKGINLWANILKMGLINKKSLKEKFKNKNAKISDEMAKKFINKLGGDVDKNIEMIVRNMRISGRKVVREEDMID